MFWNKKPTKLTAYCNFTSYVNHCPPTYEKYEIPSYLKSFTNALVLDEKSKINIPAPDIRTCPGIKDFLTSGIQLKAWEDFIIKVWPDGNFTYIFPYPSKQSISAHGPSQYGDLYPKNRINAKLNSPWSFKSDKPLKCLMMESHYSTSMFRDKNIWVPPGVIDFSKQVSTNIHLMLELRDEPYEISFKMGDPLVTLFPLTESKIDFSVEHATEEELGKLRDMPYTFKSRYYRRKD